MPTVIDSIGRSPASVTTSVPATKQLPPTEQTPPTQVAPGVGPAVPCEVPGGGALLAKGPPVPSSVHDAGSAPLLLPPLPRFSFCVAMAMRQLNVFPKDFQAIAQAEGRGRFASFLQMLGQRLANGTKVFQEVVDDVGVIASLSRASQK